MGPTRTYAGGCFTLLSVLFVAITYVYFALLGCPTPPSDCPTYDERKLWMLAILVVTISANALLWFLLARKPKE